MKDEDYNYIVFSKFYNETLLVMKALKEQSESDFSFDKEGN